MRNASSGTELIRDGSFERGTEGKLGEWLAGPQGFVLATGQGRGASQAIRCDNIDGKGWYGVSQTVALNQTNVLPLVVHGWSKAANVSGGSDSDYSLYVDLLYNDGTPLWGQTANFRVGTHDWERREVVILPEKPVKSVTLHCLFRNHSGQAWFDDVSITELKTRAGAVLFQGVAVTPESSGSATGSAHRIEEGITTQDGLKLNLENNRVTSLKIGRKELLTNKPGGFLVRDVATNSDFYGLEKGSCTELGLKVQAHYSSATNHLTIEGRLSDTRGTDRAVTLVFALPLDATGWRWGDDIRHSRSISGQGDFSKLVSVKCGATGTMSLYPLASISSENEGLALAIDMAQPGQYRVGYHAGTKQLYIAYDFGLVPETEHFPGGVDFRFVLYRFDPHWGFRGAFQKLTEIFPQYFEVRSKDQGIWMPFTDVATVQGWEDFGFRYHEGNNNVPWDDEHGVLSFRYTEPMTWWMRMPKEVPRTISQAVWLRNELERDKDKSQRSMSQVSQVAAMYDESGQPALLFRNEPWCNGAVWSLNPNPHLRTGVDEKLGANATDGSRYNAATVHWNEATREGLYGLVAKGKLDGEYLDSLEGYVTADLNFRRDHFRYSTVPLTFASDSKQPALFKGLAVFEFTKWFCGEVHELGKLTFANGVPYRFTYLCPWLDVLGTETDWVRNGKYAPASNEQMNLWRTMSGAKPYLLLMNTDYDVFTSDMVERYFQRSLFYGMFPGMFSHNAAENPYWQNPKWYNRDRPLFKRYLPLIKRIAEAGWQPVTEATCDNSNIFVERFGPDREGKLYFTVFNDTGSPQRGTLQIYTNALGLVRAGKMRELLSGNDLSATDAAEIALEPQEVKLIERAPGK